MAKLTRPIFLLTDFGLDDTYAGQVKAVIAGIAPAASIFDLSHAVSPFAIEEGAWLLETALQALPANAVVLGVVDPGVGTVRREIVIASGGRLFVGPDNGLLSAAFGEGTPGLARTGSTDVRELCAPEFRRPHVSATFHGRDIFAPAAAHLANGVDYRMMGPPVTGVTVLPPFGATTGAPGELQAKVIHIDRFGNLITTVRAAQLFPSFEITVGATLIDRRVHTFAEAPEGLPFCHADSSGFIAIAVNCGSAAETLGARPGDAVTVRAR
jgi:hypothetical protein